MIQTNFGGKNTKQTTECFLWRNPGLKRHQNAFTILQEILERMGSPPPLKPVWTKWPLHWYVFFNSLKPVIHAVLFFLFLGLVDCDYTPCWHLTKGIGTEIRKNGVRFTIPSQSSCGWPKTPFPLMRAHCVHS